MTIICLLAASLTLDYATPAGCWNEALPLGNGRLVSQTISGGDADGYVIVEPKDAAQARR